MTDKLPKSKYDEPLTLTGSVKKLWQSDTFQREKSKENVKLPVLKNSNSSLSKSVEWSAEKKPAPVVIKTIIGW